MRHVATDPPVGQMGMRVERVDRFGVVASSLCAVHCALTALLPAAFGVLGLEFLLAHQAEWVFTLVAVAFAALALALGWTRHRSTWVAVCLVLGIVGLLASRGLESGSAHHEHHGDRHHTESAASPDKGTVTPIEHAEEHLAEHPADPHASATTHDEDLHISASHMAGTAVGVLAGMILLVGHVLNIRNTRRRFGECG